LSGIASAFSVTPTSTTVAAAAISTTTAATSVTVGYQNKPAVQLWFQNTTNTAVNLVRLPILIAADGTTVAGTAGYFITIPAASQLAFDLKANAVAFGPAVWKVYADGTPASGTFVMITVPNK
jgi:ethanolamine utilization protein EutQ (cupin superfamily)